MMDPSFFILHRWIFIISGSLTMFFAMASVFVLPNYPRTTRWLTPRERAFAEYRLLEDIGEQDGDDATGLLQSTKMAYACFHSHRAPPYSSRLAPSVDYAITASGSSCSHNTATSSHKASPSPSPHPTL